MEEERKELELVPEEPAPSPAGEEPQADDICSRKVYDELFGRYARLQADFDNFRKRVERDKREHQALATERLLTDLLPVLDHLELAVQHLREAGASESLVEGVAMILRQMEGVLAKYGLQTIEALDKAFDPQVHEALMQAESADHPDRTVIAQHQRGYTLAGRTLRPARVTVSRTPAAGDPEAR